MSNTVAELQSAPYPASTIPTNTETRDQKLDEKDLIFNGERDAVVTSTQTYDDDEVEPTDEEFATLRK